MGLGRNEPSPFFSRTIYHIEKTKTDLESGHPEEQHMSNGKYDINNCSFYDV